jgi:hypothetical protein
MTDVDEAQKVCLEFADFPGADMPWLLEKAQAIEDAMSEQLDGVFLWHSVVGEPEISGFRIFFEIDPDGGGLDRSVPETLISIIREVAGDDLPGDQALAA